MFDDDTQYHLVFTISSRTRFNISGKWGQDPLN
jgi:hypothetical protein